MKQFSFPKTADKIKDVDIKFDNSYRYELQKNLNMYQRTLMETKKAKEKKTLLQIFEIIFAVACLTFVFVFVGYRVMSNYLNDKEVLNLGNKISAYYKDTLDKYVIYEKIRVREGRDIDALKRLNLPELNKYLEPRNFEAEYWEFEDETGYYSKLETIDYILQKVEGGHIYVKPKENGILKYSRLDVDVLSSDRLAENLFSKGQVTLLPDGNAEIAVRSKVGSIIEIKVYNIDTSTNLIKKITSSFGININSETQIYEYESVEVLDVTYVETLDKHKHINN